MAAPAQSLRPEVSADPAPLRRSELLLILGFWTFIALLTAANAMLDPRGRGLQPVLPTAPVVLAFIEASLWALITPAVFWLSSRFGVERTNWLRHVLLFFAIGMLISMTVDQLINYLRFEVFFVSTRVRPPGLLARLQGLWFMNEFVMYLAVLAAGFARHYFLRYRARREETIRLQAHAARLQAQLADARLAALRNQLDPHFLFNTLHAISALVERDPRGVRRMVARLSELLRDTLEGADEQEVPLQRELGFLERYLEIMRIRFQGRLEVHEEVDPDVLDALVPHLILQPLVENAIKHGVSKLDRLGRIEIRARRDGENVVLSVRDNGPAAAPPQAPAREGVGLRNTRERLAQLYGPAHSLRLEAVQDGGLLAEVTLPYHTSADLRIAEVTAGA